jgi:hypothetical protein
VNFAPDVYGKSGKFEFRKQFDDAYYLLRLFCLRAQTLLRDIIGIPLMTKIIGIGSVSVAVMQATTLQLEAVFVQERYNMYHWNYCVKMARFDHNRLSTSVMVNTSIQILINLCEMVIVCPVCSNL